MQLKMGLAIHRGKRSDMIFKNWMMGFMLALRSIQSKGQSHMRECATHACPS